MVTTTDVFIGISSSLTARYRWARGHFASADMPSVWHAAPRGDSIPSRR